MLSTGDVSGETTVKVPAAAIAGQPTLKISDAVQDIITDANQTWAIYTVSAGGTAVAGGAAFAQLLPRLSCTAHCEENDSCPLPPDSKPAPVCS